MSCYQIHFSHHDIWYSSSWNGEVHYLVKSHPPPFLGLLRPITLGPPLTCHGCHKLYHSFRSFPVSQLISSHLSKLYKFAICVRLIFRLQGHIRVFSSTLFTLRLSSPQRQNFFAHLQYCRSFLTRLNVVLMNHCNIMLPYCSKSPLQRSFSGPWVLEDL